MAQYGVLLELYGVVKAYNTCHIYAAREISPRYSLFSTGLPQACRHSNSSADREGEREREGAYTSTLHTQCRWPISVFPFRSQFVPVNNIDSTCRTAPYSA